MTRANLVRHIRREFAEFGKLTPANLDLDTVKNTVVYAYREKRVDGCKPADDADMLLVQWGPTDDNKAFELDFTRQLTESKRGDDDSIHHISVVVRYPLTPGLKKIKPGNRWLERPDPGATDKFSASLERTAVYKQCQMTDFRKIEITTDRAG
ncbi:MAG: hypothetical protein ACAI43_17615 [Phycisphaerae bacterium]|nr:hypothetical protein [Tepidisphaeraceae bacterium]